jgi:hypothetical protein
LRSSSIQVHPSILTLDRNKSPNAAKEFVKISKAYETLKDSKKRGDYDQFGEESDRPQGGGFHHQPPGFGFDPFHMFHDFFHDSPFGSQSHIQEIDYSEFDLLYNVRKHPKTHMTYIILVHPSRCGMCDQILRIFEESKESLRGLVRFRKMKILHRDMIPSGIHQIPAVISVNRGNLKSYYGPLVSQRIIDFAHEAIPKYYVADILNIKEFNTFKSGKKPRVVIFSKWKSPTVLETELAEKYRYFLRMGHIHIDSRNNWALKEFKELKMALPAAVIINGDRISWHFDLDKTKMIKLLKKTRVRIPTLWNDEMLFDYCEGRECFLYGTNDKSIKARDASILKYIDGRVAYVKNFDLLLNHFDIKEKRLFICLDIQNRMAKIWGKDEITENNIDHWYHYAKFYKYHGRVTIEYPGWEWLQIMFGAAVTLAVGFITFIVGIIFWC